MATNKKNQSLKQESSKETGNTKKSSASNNALKNKIDNSDRIEIGKQYQNISFLKSLFVVPVIYLPLFTLPFVFLSAYLSYAHLRLMGAKNVKKYRDFLPDKNSHRYKKENQIVMTKRNSVAVWAGSKLFWQFNCSFYCPTSVAIFSWHSYLVKAVENFWCPFYHQKKDQYTDAPIDYSYWHEQEENKKHLHPEDRDNPIWNKDA